MRNAVLRPAAPLRAPRAQGGVALLTVLLVVFMATLAAVELATTVQIGLRRTALALHAQQARFYALGAEEWAVQILARDAADGETDHAGEDWAQLPPVLPVEGGSGSITGQIHDLQGRFNLNNVVGTDGKLDEAQLAALVRLLEALELEPGLALAVADWIDGDQEPRFPDGAEDGDYVGRDPPYLAGNRPLASPSELRLLRGLDEEAYRRLGPHVTVLPTGSAINLNSAGAPVLIAIGMERFAAEALPEDLDEERWASVEAFLGGAALAEDALPADNLAVGSRYFLVDVEARVGEGRTRLRSVVDRDAEGGPRVLGRSYGAEDS